MGCGKQETAGICTVPVRKYRPGLMFVLQTLSGNVSLRPRTTTTQRLKPSGRYMYCQFNIQQYYVLPTQRVYVFCVDLRTNSDYFTVQH